MSTLTESNGAHSAVVLVIDDDQASIDSLGRTLRTAGYCDVVSTTDPREAMELCFWRAPDLVLLDFHMPRLNGEQVLQRIRTELPADRYLPVIVLTGDSTPTAKRRAFTAGAQDFIGKPYDAEEVLLRIGTQLEIARLHRELHEQKETLEQTVEDRTRELHSSQLELLERLARAAEYRDDDTGEHAQRVGRMSARIASELGLDSRYIELIWRAATLHDVGKIGISDTILLKPGKLSDNEMEVMRTHVRIGSQILAGGSSSYLQLAERIAKTHHEWWDGNGYLGMSGPEIPIEGRIVAIADVFDALTHERPYKSAWPVLKAVEHIRGLRGRQFDPAVHDAFIRILERDGLLASGAEGRRAAAVHSQSHVPLQIL